MKAGAAQVDITPEQPFMMGGSFLCFPSEEVLDPLMASSVVVEDANEIIAVISCDLGALSRKTVDDIREKINAVTGIPKKNINIMTTHTHSGPRTRNSPFNEADKEVVKELVEGIARAGIEAYNGMQPVQLGYGRGQVEKCAYNRRFIMSSGRSRMHPRNDDPNSLKAEGPADNEIQVVWFEDMEGNYLAVMVNFSVHPTTFYAKPLVSADFPGVIRRVLQNALEEEIPVLYLQGPCGNVNKYDHACDARWGRGLDGCRRVGRILAGEALQIISKHYSGTPEETISYLNTTLEIPYRQFSREEIESARSKWQQYHDKWEEFKQLDIEERASIKMALDMGQRLEKRTHEKAEISAFRLGDVFFVTNPGELFVEYQLELKKKFKDYRVIMTELTNGSIGYIPTRLAVALNGYEPKNRRVVKEAGDMIIDRCSSLLEELGCKPAEKGCCQ